MMMARPKTLYNTSPGSRGTSPSRPVIGKKSPAQSPARNGKTSKINSPKTPQQKKSIVGSPARNGGLTRTRSERSLTSRGSSPAKTPQSRGSEYGSIERIDATNTSRRIITSFNEGEDNINVVVRVRPLNTRELKSGDHSVIQFPGNGQIMCEGVPGRKGFEKPKVFSYNVVFEPAATQEDVLQFSGVKRLIEMSLEGFRCTAFCYGQTGSGKTHTLTGPPGLFGKKTAPYSEDHGLVFRSFLYLFQLIKEKPGVHFVLKASFLEIYNEKVIDLLNPGSLRKPLAVRWSKKARGFFVENLFTVDCEELDDLVAVLEEGMRNRSVGSHFMNDNSSRSHTMLTVHITSEQPAENGVFISRSGKINFVDLAGSEMTKKTQSAGKTLVEANNINKSLMVLGYCIASLSDPKRRNNNHIPYRDSKLTKLLADSLAGNGVTLMIACISPARYNFAESVNTLRYAARAKKIRTKPIVLMDPREALILSLKREVSVLQTENEHLRLALSGVRTPYELSGPPDPNSTADRLAPHTPPHIDVEKLAELEGPQLIDLIRLYMTENDDLRKENEELFTSRDALLRDQELVSRENERLLKKLEDVNRACVRSPLIGAHATLSSDLRQEPNIWTNPEEDTALPESIRKEMDKRRIGDSVEKVGTHKRHNSWDGRPGPNNAIRVRSSGSDRGLPSREPTQPNAKQSDDTAAHPSISDKPRFSMGNKEVFGSSISLDQDEDDIFARP